MNKRPFPTSSSNANMEGRPWTACHKEMTTDADAFLQGHIAGLHGRTEMTKLNEDEIALLRRVTDDIGAAVTKLSDGLQGTDKRLDRIIYRLWDALNELDDMDGNTDAEHRATP